MTPNLRHSERRALSPIMAAVLIIALTLTASVMLGGMVYGYGIFQTSGYASQVGAAGSYVPAAVEHGVSYVTSMFQRLLDVA